MSDTSPRGPRILFGFVGLVLVVLLAAYAGELLLERSRQEQARARDLLGHGEAPPAEAGTAPEHAPGWGRIVLGAPSGAPARPRPATPAEEPPGPDGPPLGPDVLDQGPPLPGPADPPAPPRWPADLELVVRSGQSLSKIAAQSYGRSTDDLVRRLAEYNGLADPDRLRAGQDLLVPVREKLLASTSER